MSLLDECFTMGLTAVGRTLLCHLGQNFKELSQMKEVGLLSETMMITLLEINRDAKDFTLYRFRTILTWLANNPMSPEVLGMINFEDFTIEDLASDVTKSGLFSIGRIMVRMMEIFIGDQNILINQLNQINQSFE